jgi:hypothetical protein
VFLPGSLRNCFSIGSESIPNRLNSGRPRKNAMCNKIPLQEIVTCKDNGEVETLSRNDLPFVNFE